MCAIDETAFREDGRWLANHYACDCGSTWSDQWACACDDDCPDCGATCSPDDSDDLTADVLQDRPDLAAFVTFEDAPREIERRLLLATPMVADLGFAFADLYRTDSATWSGKFAGELFYGATAGEVEAKARAFAREASLPCDLDGGCAPRRLVTAWPETP